MRETDRPSSASGEGSFGVGSGDRPRGVAKGQTWGERLADIGRQMDAADAESPMGGLGFVKTYIPVPDGEGGMKLGRTEPFQGSEAPKQSHGGFPLPPQKPPNA